MRIKATSLTIAITLTVSLTAPIFAAPQPAKTTAVRDRDDNPIVRLVKQIKHRLATAAGEIIIPPPQSNTP